MKRTLLFSKKIYTILFFLLTPIFCFNLNAQTVLISPTGDGGFETGTTFAANGWTAVNTASTNKAWYVGTGNTGFTGARSAFIGDNSTTVGNNNSARKIHIYRSITIPAGATNINLSFKYKQEVSDYIGSTYYDYITVYTNNTPPTSGTLPEVGGTLQFGPYPNADVNEYTSQNTTLPNSLAGTTTNLIFTFTSDAANPRGFGAVDDVSLTYTLATSPPTITSLGTLSGCIGGSITINGTNLTGATAAGVTIGGTAVSSITSNSGTVLVAVIGAGTTGTVSITTPAGTATSAASFTVDAVPAQPSAITGSTTPCSGSSQTYSVTDTGVTYTWSFPAGWSQTAGGTTNSVTVTTNGTSGNVSVTPSNTCGNGTIRTLAVAPTTVPAQPSTITGATAACVTGSRTYSVTNVPGTAYTWSLPLGWIQTGGTTTNSITVTAGATGGTISVTPSNSCGNGSVRTLAVSSISGVPAQPSTITGNTTPCATTSQTYSVTNVAGTTYTWVFPSGWVQTAGGTTNSITVTPSTTSGNITVTPSNDCGSGTARTLAVIPSAVPAQPSLLTGNTTICSSSSQIYSVTSVTGVAYAWTFPAGWIQTAGGTTSSVTVTTNGTSGNVSVTPSNACGNGTARTLAITSTTVPGQPSTITGNSTPCIGATLTYSVTNISGTTYSWILPSGWSQTAGGTTNSITVIVGATAGNIEVVPSNTCGSGATRTFSASPILGAAQPSTITGSTTTCQGSSLTYSVNNIAGVTYNWTFPAGWTQTAGGTTSTITVTAGSSSGNIQVTPSTACGSGTARTLAVIATAIPTITSTTPGSRTGIGTVPLSATASGGTISWYANLTGGSALGTGNNFTTPGIITTTTYYVDSYNGLCGSSPRIAVVATVNFPEISVSGNGFNIADEDITPITTDFTNLGTANIGFNIARTYTIQNSGTVDLSIGTISIGGVNNSEFVVTTPPSATIIPGGSTTFTITFTPTAIGTRNANISFVTNDPDENPFNFNIAATGGSGVIPEINIQGLAGNNILDGDSGSTTTDGTDFGSVTIPGTITRTFTIQNTGTGPLLLTGTPLVVLTGSSNFVVTTQPSSNTIPAGGNLTFQITFNPTVTGSSVALVSINNNDSNESIYDFAITGAAVVTGVEIDIQGNEVSITDGDVTPSVIDQTDFGITDSVTPIPLTYNVYSFGSNNLTLTSVISITGTNAALFSVTNLPTSLAPGAVTSFVITFTPTASLGVKTATVSITSNDPDEGTYNFDIRAEVQTLAPLTVAPGGITSNLKFWLKANSSIGTVADNTTITTWPDQTYGSTKNAIAPFSKEPKFQNNPSYNVNFNPVIHFNGNNTMSGGQGFNNSDMFIVVKPTNTVSYTSSPQDIYSGDDIETNKGSQDVTGFQMGNTSARHNNDLIAYNQAANTSYGLAETSTTKSYSGINIFNPRKSGSGSRKMDILNNGNTLTTTEYLTNTSFGSGPPYTYLPYKDIVNTRYWLGRSEFFDASYDGDILEVINYNIRNSDADKSKIETYLAIKYGITLGINGTSQNYINSAGTTIYAAGSGFNYNIAGIGRDDKSLLNQKQSKTENSNSDITIGLGNIFDRNSDNTNTFNDKDFLVWGNNNNTLTAQSPIVVDMSTATIPALSTEVDFISIGRTWKVIETGINVPSVKVSIPSVMLTATITPPGDFLMFISDSPVFNPTAEYRIMKENGSNLETNYDFNGTKYITFGYAPERTFIRAIDFDGVNDYLDAGKVLDLNTSFTVSAWIKRSATNQTILSKRNNPFTEGYDLSINSSQKAEMSWFNGTKQTITSVTSIPAEKWHHIGIIYNGTTAKLYIDGVLDTSKMMATVPANTQSFLIAAANGESPTSFFNGTIDEVRVWNVDLSEKQLRYVMNQEISRNATFTGGNIVPNTISLNEIGTIPWTNLSAYYPMSTYTFTNAKDISSNNYTAALKNLTTVDWQTAPLPYESELNGNWETAATWKNNIVQDLPYSTSIVDGTTLITWNIVKTNNNITSPGNKKVLGLFVNSNTLTATTDSKIEVSHYLKLDGKIDLQGRSQLVQTDGSDLDPESSGSLERDQQGQSNKFNYNYWGSPVGEINNTTNNNNFTVAYVLRNGTNPLAPGPITWIDGFDGTTSPFSLARYWIYKFDSNVNAIDYANWTQIGETGILQAGKGFTLKGPGTSGTQNLTFVGKPNNGTITNTVGSDQLLLVGNPYPSALDADKFISDNINSIETSISNAAIDGALYFWEHYPSNTSHNLGAYLGGYGIRNLAGGVSPSSVGVDYINTTGTSLRAEPKRYIPVGQGFFVIGKIGSGGTVTFNNSQREFIKEDNTSFSQTTYRIPKTPKDSNHWTDNSNARIENDTHKRVRLGFNLYNQSFHRQVLLAFMDEKANSEMNDGYDAYNIDDSPSDMYLLNGENELAIQGEGYFDEEASYPIGVRSETTGKISFVLDDLENFDESQNIFIHDNETDTYHSIKGKAYEVELPAGTFNERFSLRFIDKSLATKDPIYDNAITVFFTRSNNVLNIKNSVSDNTVLSASLYNIQGRLISKWDVEEKEQSNIKIPIQDKTSAVYLVKLKTAKGNISKKIIIK